MTKQEEQTFRKIIREETLGVLTSEGGQGAIVDAVQSKGGQDAIKRGALAALKSDEGQSILSDSFVNNTREVIIPILENMSDNILEIKTDLSKLKEVAVKRDEFTEDTRKRMLTHT